MATMAAFVMCWFVAIGAAWVSVDWDALACFDGDEPGCDDNSAGSGLGDVRLSSWLLAAAGAAAAVAAFVLAWRMRRAAYLGWVVTLCAVQLGVTAVLNARL